MARADGEEGERWQVRSDACGGAGGRLFTSLWSSLTLWLLLGVKWGLLRLHERF